MHQLAFISFAVLLAFGAMGQDEPGGGAGPYRGTQSDGGRARATLDQSVVEGCLMCHRGELSLGDRDPSDLAAKIASISQGEAEHLVPLPPLNETDREALAEALAAAPR